MRRHSSNAKLKDWNGPRDHYVYDDLTGWRHFKSEMIKMDIYSGHGGLYAKKDIAYPVHYGLVPYTVPAEKPIQETRTNHTEYTDAVEPYDWTTVDPMSLANPLP